MLQAVQAFGFLASHQTVHLSRVQVSILGIFVILLHMMVYLATGLYKMHNNVKHYINGKDNI